MFSVVIPTHNRLDDLRNAVNSVFQQSKVPQELIVVDDGSAPLVDESIFEGAPANIECRILRNQTPRGGNFTRNRGVIEATQEFVVFLDDDDVFMPEKIEKLTIALASNSDADVLYHAAEIRMVNEKVSYFSKPLQFQSDSNIFQTLLLKNGIGGTSMVAVRKSALESVGLFDENMPALQDYDLWLRLAKSNARFLYIPQPLTLYHYYTAQHSVTKSIDKNLRAYAMIESKYKADYELLSDQDKKQHEARKLKAIAHKYILIGNRRLALKGFWKLFWFKPNIKNLATLCALSLGTRTFFYLLSKQARL